MQLSEGFLLHCILVVVPLRHTRTRTQMKAQGNMRLVVVSFASAAPFTIHKQPTLSAAGMLRTLGTSAVAWHGTSMGANQTDRPTRNRWPGRAEYSIRQYPVLLIMLPT